MVHALIFFAVAFVAATATATFGKQDRVADFAAGAMLASGVAVLVLVFLIVLRGHH